MGGMSNDEKQRMHLYTKILEYEQDMVRKSQMCFDF